MTKKEDEFCKRWLEQGKKIDEKKIILSEIEQKQLQSQKITKDKNETEEAHAEKLRNAREEISNLVASCHKIVIPCPFSFKSTNVVDE